MVLAVAVLAASALVIGASDRQAPVSPPPVPATSCHGTGTLGVEIGPLTAAARTRRSVPVDVSGVVVTHVLSDGPAARAGLQSGDVIVAVDGTAVPHDCAFVQAAWARDCEDAILVTWRAGRTHTVVIAPVVAEPLIAARCEAGDAEACFRQAWGLWSRQSSTDVRARALALYERSCRGGSAAGCAYYGVHLGEAPGRESEQRAAFERACTLNDGTGCAHLAYLHATGDGLPRDHGQATTLYEKACGLGDAKGCFNVGLNYEEGRGVQRNLVRARAAYEAGCQGGSPMACTNLGGLLQSGALGTAEPAQAVDAWSQGCAGSACEGANLLGCMNLARAYRDGIGTAADPGRAVELLAAVCDNAIDNAVAAATQQVKACALLGGMHLAGTAPGASATRGRDLSERACEGGDDFGCFNAATAHAAGLGGAVDQGRATGYFEDGCTAGDAESCHEWSLRLESGTGTPRDAARARTARGRACAGGFQKACTAPPPRD